MLALLGCLGIIFLILVGALVRAWALAKLWIWFIVPVFHLPTLTMAQAYGIAMTIGLFAEQHSDAKEEDDEVKKWTSATSRIIIGPLIAVLFGWVVKTFWM